MIPPTPSVVRSARVSTFRSAPLAPRASSAVAVAVAVVVVPRRSRVTRIASRITRARVVRSLKNDAIDADADAEDADDAADDADDARRRAAPRRADPNRPHGETETVRLKR
jgi:hypothetical protein